MDQAKNSEGVNGKKSFYFKHFTSRSRGPDPQGLHARLQQQRSAPVESGAGFPIEWQGRPDLPHHQETSSAFDRGTSLLLKSSVKSLGIRPTASRGKVLEIKTLFAIDSLRIFRLIHPGRPAILALASVEC